jgi:hypothetical protein
MQPEAQNPPPGATSALAPTANQPAPAVQHRGTERLPINTRGALATPHLRRQETSTLLLPPQPQHSRAEPRLLLLT